VNYSWHFFRIRADESLMKPPPRSSIVLFIAAIWILWAFGYKTVWQRFTISVDGVIVSSRDFPEKGAPRYRTEYVIRDAGGRDLRYIAGATDGSLERSLPVGTRIRKEWGELDYEVNGRRIGFPTYFYSAIFGVALFCLLSGAWQWRSADATGGRRQPS
jgi:hypothetical protein